VQYPDDDIQRELIRLSGFFGAGSDACSQPLYYACDCTVVFMVEVDQRQYHIDVRDGVIESVTAGPLLMRPWQFAIRASEHSWRQFWLSVPPPGFNDIFAMTSYGHARIDGDVGPLLKDLRFIKTLLALPRGRLDGQAL